MVPDTFLAFAPLLVHNTCVAENRVRGLQAQQQVKADLRASGFRVVGEEVYVRTAFGRRRIDMVVEKAGKLHGVEVKSGGAVRSTAQKAKDTFINLGGAEAFGKQAVEQGIAGQMIETITTVTVP